MSDELGVQAKVSRRAGKSKAAPSVQLPRPAEKGPRLQKRGGKRCHHASTGQPPLPSPEMHAPSAGAASSTSTSTLPEAPKLPSDPRVASMTWHRPRYGQHGAHKMCR